MKKIIKWGLIIFVLLVIVAIFSPGEEESPQVVSNEEIQNLEQTDGENVKDESNDDSKNIPAEYKSALNKANTYANTQSMSKKRVYDQLVSEYGEKFSVEAAQYAIDNVQADWNANALAKAKSYQEQQNMSPARIRDQLVSEYGEQFTPEEAEYAITNLNK
jgi:hypothetical protein